MSPLCPLQYISVSQDKSIPIITRIKRSLMSSFWLDFAPKCQFPESHEIQLIPNTVNKLPCTLIQKMWPTLAVDVTVVGNALPEVVNFGEWFSFCYLFAQYLAEREFKPCLDPCTLLHGNSIAYSTWAHCYLCKLSDIVQWLINYTH